MVFENYYFFYLFLSKADNFCALKRELAICIRACLDTDMYIYACAYRTRIRMTNELVFFEF